MMTPDSLTSPITWHHSDSTPCTYQKTTTQMKESSHPTSTTKTRGKKWWGASSEEHPLMQDLSISTRLTLFSCPFPSPTPKSDNSPLTTHVPLLLTRYSEDLKTCASMRRYPDLEISWNYKSRFRSSWTTYANRRGHWLDVTILDTFHTLLLFFSLPYTCQTP